MSLHYPCCNIKKPPFSVPHIYIPIFHSVAIGMIDTDFMRLSYKIVRKIMNNLDFMSLFYVVTPLSLDV